MSVWIDVGGDKGMWGIKEGVWATLNRMWQAQNDGLAQESGRHVVYAHTHRDTLRTHTYTLRHGKVGTSMRGQFDLFHQTQINVYVALFSRHIHTYKGTQIDTHTQSQSVGLSQTGTKQSHLSLQVAVPAWLWQPGWLLLDRLTWGISTQPLYRARTQYSLSLYILYFNRKGSNMWAKWAHLQVHDL